MHHLRQRQAHLDRWMGSHHTLMAVSYHSDTAPDTHANTQDCSHSIPDIHRHSHTDCQQCPHSATPQKLHQIHASNLFLPTNSNLTPRRKPGFPKQHTIPVTRTHSLLSDQNTSNSERPPQTLLRRIPQHTKHNFATITTAACRICRKHILLCCTR